VWITPTGQKVAEVAQGVAIENGVAKAVYYAIAGGESVPRKRFKCATDQITQWLRANRIVATMKM